MSKSLTMLMLAGMSTALFAENKPSLLSREKGAIYLEDITSKPIKLKVIKPANGYGHLDGSRYLGTFLADREVTLLAVSDRAYRVKGRAQQGDIAAWAGTAFFEGLKPETVEKLKQMAERQKVVGELIARHEVAMGMTLEEVQQSIGKPSKVESSTDKSGRVDCLHYITTKRVPQYNYTRSITGQLVRQVYYVEVETGRLSINFENEVVTSISQSEDKRAKRARVVAVPIEIW